jgi:thiamine-monophosphate kinase
MNLNDIGEFGFIRRIRRGCITRPEGVLQGIGDDAAAFRSDGRLVSLVTTDLLVERVHFLREAISGYDLGRKSLAVNLSDIAAMGGTAREAFVSIAVPDGCALAYLEDIFQGMKDLARDHAVNILGGDTTFSLSDLIINVAVYGVVAENEMLTRAAARPGDVVFCTGCLGTAAPACTSSSKAPPPMRPNSRPCWPPTAGPCPTCARVGCWPPPRGCGPPSTSATA